MKKITKLLLIITSILLLTGCDLFKKEETYDYKLQLYNINEVDSVSIVSNAKEGKTIEILNQSKIKIIYYMFEGKKSNEKGTDDKPRNTNIMYTVTFKAEKNKRSLYIYKKDDKYYIEEAKGGLYETTEEDFEKLEKIVDEEDFKYTIDNYELENVVSVKINTMGQFDEPIVFTDDKNIGIIYSIFSKKKTDTTSNEYNPIEPDILFEVNFYNSENADGPRKEFYIYKKQGKYYIEESMRAIYTIDESEFNIIENYVKAAQSSKEKDAEKKEA